MAIHEQTASFDVVVVGGGFSGVCAAIAAAREGAKVALVQNRPVFGGSGSSETRMHIVGANCHSSKPNLRETGILEEILLENKRRNPYADFPVFDTIVWEKVRMEPNITILLNTNIDDVVLDGDRILAVTGCQNTTETRWTVYGKIFIDATGHGTVGVMAGAESRIGSESKHEFNEPTAPEEANNNKMGNTIMFTAIDRGEPVTFIKPVWANTYSEEDLKYRPHVDRVCAQADGGGLVSVDAAKNQLPEFSNVDAGYWWIELGGDAEDIIQESEQIHEDLLKVLYGVWDHIKNQADHGAQNLDLNWVSTVPGCRESRRLVGDYLLNENDVRANRVFDDAVAYGGWPMDEHTAAGFRAKGEIPSVVRSFKGLYSIPYGCYCSRTIDNLMMAGRDISASKLAMGSTRVMGTCAVGGEAVGVAAANAALLGLTPAQYGRAHMHELQQKLLACDLYVMGQKNEDPNDLALRASVSASSEQPGFEAKNVISGVTRREGEQSNLWRSAALGEGGETLTLTLAEPAPVHEVRLVFDPDLSEERCISVSKAFIMKEPRGVAQTLVRDYRVELLRAGETVAAQTVTANHQRRNAVSFDGTLCDSVRVHVLATNGCEEARIYEIRVY